MPEKRYDGNSQHELLLRENYNEIFKTLGEEIGLEDFSYDKYRNDLISPTQKEKFEERLKEEIENPTNPRIRSSLNFINSSAMVINRDKINDFDSFLAFGEKTVKKTPEEEMETGSSSMGEDPFAIEGEARSTAHEAGTLKREFAGYDKNLTFFKAIKKAYTDRKAKTNSRLLGTVSAIRAAFCKAKKPLIIAGALGLIVVPGVGVLAGVTHLASTLATGIGTFVGVSSVGLALQKIEDGKLNHGLIAKVKHLFTKNKEDDQNVYPEPARTDTATGLGRDRDSGRADVEPEAVRTETPREAEVHPSPEEPLATGSIASDDKDNILDITKKYDETNNQLKLMQRAISNGYKLTLEDKIKFQNLKLDVEELRDKLDRSLPLENDLDLLNEELTVEQKRLEFWENSDRVEGLNNTKKRIAELKNRIHSCQNTKTLCDLSIERLNYLSENFSSIVKEYPDSADALKTEMKFLREVILRHHNEEMLKGGKEQLISNLRRDYPRTDQDEIFELESSISTPLDYTIRKEELEMGKRIAVKLGKHELIDRYDEELAQIELKFNPDMEKQNLNTYVQKRLSELEKGKQIAKRIDREDLIEGYDQEKKLLQNKYQGIIYTSAINAANWGTNKEEPEESRTR